MGANLEVLHETSGSDSFLSCSADHRHFLVHLRRGQGGAQDCRAEAKSISQAVHQYTVDKGTPPKSLDDLVDAGYLKAIPGRGRLIYTDPVPPQKGRT